MTQHTLSATFLAAVFACGAAAQGAWSPDFDQRGLGVGGRVFSLGTWRNELVAGTYHNVWRDGAWLAHVARFDGVRWHPLGSGVDGHVRAICEFAGDLYIGGAFSFAGSTPVACVARWNGSQWTPVGAGFDGEVWSLTVHQGQLHAGGYFTHSGSQVVNRVARWNGSQWQPLGSGLTWQLGVYAVGRTMLSVGTDLYVGGDFDHAGGVPCSYVARWNGTSWSPLGGGINDFRWGEVWALASHQGRIYCAGAFGQAGTVLSDNIAAWDGSQWHAVGAGLQNSSFGAGANSLCVFNGEVYVGGEFQVAGNPDVPAETIGVYHIASYDGAAWQPVGGGHGLNGGIKVFGRFQGQTIAGGNFSIAGQSTGWCVARFDGDEWRAFGRFDGLVADMCEHQNELWVAGDFYTADGIVANGVARFDGTRWYAVGGGPGPSRASAIASYQGQIHIGTVGSPLRWNGAVWQTFTPPITGAITEMIVHNGVLYMGGATPYHPGTPNLFAWNGTTLSVPGGGVNDFVESLHSFGGELIVGGRFTRAGPIAARSIARWNGSSWSTFGGVGIQGDTVSSMHTFRGELVIGGEFSRFMGAPADYIARWTGSAWAPLAAAQPDGPVFAMLGDDARGELLAGGGFLHVGAMDSCYVGAFEAQPFWTDVGAPLANARRAPRLTGDGRLFPGARTRVRLSSAAENAAALFVCSVTRVDQPVFGGVLVPAFDARFWWPTDGAGTASLAIQWPASGVPSGATLWSQAWIVDSTGPQGMTASNAVKLRAP